MGCSQLLNMITWDIRQKQIIYGQCLREGFKKKIIISMEFPPPVAYTMCFRAIRPQNRFFKKLLEKN